MPQRRIPAVFMRGGTANAVAFHQKDLSADRRLWDDIFLAAIGSPDPYGRQLDGMAVASRIAGSLVHEATRATSNPDAELRIGMRAGVITAAAEVRLCESRWEAERGSFLRT